MSGKETNSVSSAIHFPDQEIPNRVLVVDDDPTILKLVQRILSKAGFDVTVTERPGQVLKLIEQQCPDYIITDWVMPEMDGPTLCRKIRTADLPHYVYILFLTGKSSGQDIIDGLESGADDFVIKPIRPGELLARLKAGARVLSMERQLQDLVQTDPLTGTMTRRAFERQAEREMVRAQRYNLDLSCVMVDVDFFKKINDTYGHPVGDQVLTAVGQLLMQNTRRSDLVARYGGEEFCVLLPETDEENAVYWADRTRQALKRLVFRTGEKDKTFRISASFGVSCRLADTRHHATLIDMADQALLVAKQSGRDRVVCFSQLSEEQDIQLQQNASQDPLEGVPASAVMSPLVCMLKASDPVWQAADLFLRFRINSAPVTDDEGKLVGILSEKDILAALSQPDVWKQPVEKFMRTEVVCYEEDTPAKKIQEFLCRVSIRRVVVVQNGRPVGIISRGSFLRWYINWLATHDPEAAASGDQQLQCRMAQARSNVRLAAEAIIQQATQLKQSSGESQGEFLPELIDRASAIQELVNDMLAESRSFLADSCQLIE